MRVRLLIGLLAGCLLPGAVAVAQLPADAVQLEKVNIIEKQKSEDLDPVYLVDSDPAGPTWEYKGIKYRGSKPDSKEKFDKDPDKFAKAAEKQRYVNNFMQSMSTVWCPIMDEITPGGMTQWKRHGLIFESCCQFCDENFEESQFDDGVVRLKKRGAESYDKMMANGGIKYTGKEGKSPVEGAIKKEDDQAAK